MTGKISLTASMRSNLLSLQNISRQVSATQNKLATGNKVNSAIDNPSSYYTARALNNRADDLNALLDSMGQAISTIKAATTALETGAAFLEQAAAVATQALETTSIPAKSYFEERIGENGAVVATAQELKDAVASGKETICVYGTIDYFENESIVLQDNQKLVGTEYFTGYTGKEKFSQLNFQADQAIDAVKIAQNTLVSDIGINYINTNPDDANISAINAYNMKASIANADITMSYTHNQNGNSSRAILAHNSDLTLTGAINLSNNSEKYAFGIYARNSNITFTSQCSFTFQGTGSNAVGLRAFDNAVFDIKENVQINIDTPGNTSRSVLLEKQSSLILDQRSEMNISSGNVGFGLTNGSTAEILGKLNIKSESNAVWLHTQPNKLHFHKSSQISLNSGQSAVFSLSPEDSLLFDAGTKIENNKNFFIAENYELTNKNSSTQDFSADTLLASGKFTATTAFDTINWANFTIKIPEPRKENNIKEYIATINQYDSLIKDASYKGINLLQNEQLGVNFNENRNASLNVQGRDMGAAALGLTTLDWQTQDNIAQSLSEISAALKTIRSFSAELGNNYSIITNRQNFTENLINILTEGADKLTLADMNEESANMLALQTRQQLAVNSLSLASQSNQAVLKLF